ncbi:MAG: cyclic nucleotide-binding domain-containing protein, partial [Bacteroidota bacterium]
MDNTSGLFKDFAGLISSEDIKMAQPFLKTLHFEKDDLLLKKGEVCSFLYYIIDGIALYITLEGKKEQVVHVSFAGEFCLALYSFYARLPSEANIRALTKMQVIGLDYEKVQHLFDKSKNWERVGRLFAERAFIDALRTKHDIQHKTAHYRYQKLIEQRPEILAICPKESNCSISG